MTHSVQGIDALLAEHAALETQLSDPALHNDPSEARRAGRCFAQLAPIIANHRKLARILTTLQDVGLGYMKIGQTATTMSGGLMPSTSRGCGDARCGMRSGIGTHPHPEAAFWLAQSAVRIARIAHYLLIR